MGHCPRFQKCYAIQARHSGYAMCWFQPSRETQWTRRMTLTFWRGCSTTDAARSFHQELSHEPQQ